MKTSQLKSNKKLGKESEETKQISETEYRISKINFTGNIIPDSWFEAITWQGGKIAKPCLTGIVILSEIIYWYRPIIVRDEQTGKIAGYKSKFSADKLHLSYDQVSQKFGISKSCLLYTSPSPRDLSTSRMPSSA